MMGVETKWRVNIKKGKSKNNGRLINIHTPTIALAAPVGLSSLRLTITLFPVPPGMTPRGILRPSSR